MTELLDAIKDLAKADGDFNKRLDRLETREIAGGGAAVADLGSTAETVGGAHDDGVAVTASRSDHKHEITNPKLDDLATPDDNTDLNASTSRHGLLLKATAPGANELNVVGIANGETVYANKALFDATNPAALGVTAPGTSLLASHRDHIHTLPKLDDLNTPDDNTDLNANTTNHGLLLKAVAPAAGIVNLVGIGNGETIYALKTVSAVILAGASGVAFPGSPATGQKFFRTDLGWDCYYDGTRWLTCNEFQADTAVGAPAVSGTGVVGLLRQDYGKYVTRYTIDYMVTTTNDGSKYWTIKLEGWSLGRTAQTVLDTFTTAANSPDVWYEIDRVPNTLQVMDANDSELGRRNTLTSTAGVLTFRATAYYRLIVT